MSATKRPFDTAWDIEPASWGWIAGLRMGKMKCVNSATPGPMKMNQARNLLDHVDLQRRHRQEESRKDDLGVERPSQIRLDPQDQRDQARSTHDDDRWQPDTSVAGSHRQR